MSLIRTLSSDVSKVKGIHPDTPATINGNLLTADQRSNVETVLGICDTLKTKDLVTLAATVAGIGESAFKTHNRNASTGADGVFQLIPGTAEATGLSPYDTAATFRYWLKTGYYLYGGAIAIAAAHPDWSAGKIAAAVEGSYSDLDAGAKYYDQFQGQAKALIHAFGGTAGSAGSLSTPDGSSASNYAFARGTSDNPDEDSWQCMSRLAQEVQWYLFSNANALYYMDGPDLIGQKPAAVIDRAKSASQILRLSFTWDNSAFNYKAAHGARTRSQRTSRTAKIAGPTEARLDLVCGIDDFRAGDVFQLVGYGPADGRWLVTDATRSVFQPFTSFTLDPPLSPLKDPAKVANNDAAAATATAGGTRAAIVAAAKRAISEQPKYQYDEVRPMPSSLFGSAPRRIDCSGFVTLAYKTAGVPDPNGNNYNGNGFTGTLIANGKKTTSPLPGDLVFYRAGGGPLDSPGHVALYVGGSLTDGLVVSPFGLDGQIANMGAPGEPVLESVSAPGAPIGFYTYPGLT